MCWATIGTDTGGSIRIPAAACGIVGLKPSFGEIPTTGVLPLSSSLDHVGPLARTVSDAWTIYDVIRGHPPHEHQAHGPQGITLGRLGGYFLEKLDDDVRTQFGRTIERLELAGARVTDVNVSGAANIPGIYNSVSLPEAYAHHAATLATRRDDYTPGVAQRLESGRTIPTNVYMQAQSDRTVLRDRVDAALAKCDALVLPTLAIPAPLIGASTVHIGSVDEPIRPMTLRLTQLFNLTGHPAISIPCGFTRDGLPCGFQMVGRRQDTAALLAAALGCEPHISVTPFSCCGRRTATAAD
jgi:aspartyl-tRNA(Asn)/glutamyl-tRNA(Gln) amidotransferase subunit A